MSVTCKIRSIDLSGAAAKGKVVEQRVKTAVTLAAREDTKPYVPYVTGDLRGTAETESIPEQGLLIYGNASVPYARAQYYGLKHKTWPGTCMQWFEAAKAANKLQWQAVAREESRRVCG